MAFARQNNSEELLVGGYLITTSPRASVRATVNEAVLNHVIASMKNRFCQQNLMCRKRDDITLVE